MVKAARASATFIYCPHLSLDVGPPLVFQERARVGGEVWIVLEVYQTLFEVTGKEVEIGTYYVTV